MIDLVPLERLELIQELGSLLRDFRESRRVKAKDVADGLRVGSPKITRIEQGHWIPDATTLQCIAEILQLSPELIDHLLDLSSAYLMQREDIAEEGYKERVLQRETRARELKLVGRSIPSLLQTERYAREFLRAQLGLIAPHTLQTALLMQKERRDRLMSNIEKVSIILFEEALCLNYGAPAIMVEQLEYLRSLPSFCDLAIIPLEEQRVTPLENFRIADDRVVLFDGPCTVTSISFTREVVRGYLTVYQQLEGISLPHESVSYIWEKYRPGADLGRRTAQNA